MKFFTKSKHRLALLALFAGGVASVLAGETTVYENGVVDLQNDIDVTTLSDWEYDGSLLYMVKPGVFFPFTQFMTDAKTRVSAFDGSETQTFEVLLNQNPNTIGYMPTYDSIFVQLAKPLLDLTEHVSDSNTAWYFDEDEMMQESNGIFSFKKDGYTSVILDNKTTQEITLFWVEKLETPDSLLHQWNITTYEGKANHISKYYTPAEGDIIESSDPSVLRITSDGTILALEPGEAEVRILDSTSMDTLKTISVSVLDIGLYDPNIIVPVHDVEIEKVQLVNANELKIELNVAVADVSGLQDYIYIKVRYTTTLKSDTVEERIVKVQSVSLEGDNTVLSLELDESVAQATEIEVVFLEGGITGLDGKALSSAPAVASIYTATSVSDLGATVTVQPNPCADMLTIVGGTEVTITNLSGNIVLSEGISILGSTLDVGTLPAGMYVAVVKSAKGTEYVTFTKK